MRSSKNRAASAARSTTSSSAAFGIFAGAFAALSARSSFMSRESSDFIEELNSETAAESMSDCFFLSAIPSAAETDFSKDSVADLTARESDSRAAGSSSFETPELSKLAAFPFTAQRTYEKNPGAFRS